MATPDVDPFEAAYDELLGESDDNDTPEPAEEEAGQGTEVEAEDDDQDDVEGEEEPPEDADEGEDEEDGEDESQGADDEPNVITVESEDQIIRLPDGTEVSVKDSALRQADYTRKTQELAESRKLLEAEKAELQGQADKLIDYIAQRQDNPASWVTEIVSGSQEPTLTLARALQELAAAGKLDPRFVETFGIESGPVADYAAKGVENDRVSRLEKQLQEREEREQAARKQQEILAQYQQQYQEILTDHNVKFASADEERDFRVELLTYARDNQIPNLKWAYAQMALSRPTASTEPAAKKPDPSVQRKKKAAQAVAKRSAANPGKTDRPKPKNTLEAAQQSVEELLGL